MEDRQLLQKQTWGKLIQTSPNGGLVLPDAARIQLFSFYTLKHFLAIIICQNF